MGELRADWRLRLRREGAHGPICGAGVLVDQHTALTCAHVVDRPDAVMWLEFAENSDIEPVAARVLPGGWLPALEAPGDVSSDESADGYVVTGAAHGIGRSTCRSSSVSAGW